MRVIMGNQSSQTQGKECHNREVSNNKGRPRPNCEVSKSNSDDRYDCWQCCNVGHDVFKKLFDCGDNTEVVMDGSHCAQHFQETAIPDCPFYAQLLLNNLCQNNTKLTLEEFSGAVAKTCGLSREEQIKFYFQLFAHDCYRMKQEDFLKLLHVSYCAFWRMNGIVPVEMNTMEDKYVQGVIASVVGTEQLISEDKFTAWCNRVWLRGIPLIHEYTTAVLQGHTFNHLISVENAASTVHQTLSDGGSILTQTCMWLLSCALPSEYIPAGSNPEGGSVNCPVVFPSWDCLYDSSYHGLSVNRFKHHVLSYKGPSIMLIDFDGASYCTAVDTEWRESSRRWGGSGCMLIKLRNDFRIMQSGPDLVYYNDTDRTAPKGLYVGKVLQIDEEFSKVLHYGVQLKLHAIEVWGCGGITARSKQLEQKEWEEKHAQKLKDRKLKIDVEEWKNSPDRAILQMGGVTVEHAER